MSDFYKKGTFVRFTELGANPTELVGKIVDISPSGSIYVLNDGVRFRRTSHQLKTIPQEELMQLILENGLDLSSYE